MDIDSIKNKLRRLLTVSMEDTIYTLNTQLVTGSDKNKLVILLEGQYVNSKTDSLRGIIKIEDRNLSYNKIRNGLLEIIEGLSSLDFDLSKIELENNQGNLHNAVEESSLKSFNENKSFFRKVKAISCGYGFWARNRTISPFLLENSDLLEIIAITDLVGGEKEFLDIKAELEEINFKRQLPARIHMDELQNLPSYILTDFNICYNKNIKSDFYTLSDEFFEGNKRAVLKCLYEINPRLLKPKINPPKYYPSFHDAYNEHKKDVEAVIINTPNSLHLRLSDAALRKKLHVYAERPINPYEDQLGSLLWSANSQKRLIYSGVQRRLEDPFRYFYYVVKNKIHFKTLRSIKILLSSGRKLKGWRLDKKRAGGGIITDEGYHLLDAAAWVTNAANPTVKYEYSDIKGSVIFRYDPVSWQGETPENIETSAFGFIQLPDDIDLKFDLSYNAPENSIFEFFEIKDNEGNMVRLIRDQSNRSSNPAIITHQLSNGQLVAPQLSNEGIVKDGHTPVHNPFYINMDKISFSGKANTFGPLSQFLINILSNKVYNENIINSEGIECDANLLVNTDELIKAIYHLQGKTAK